MHFRPAIRACNESGTVLHGLDMHRAQGPAIRVGRGDVFPSTWAVPLTADDHSGHSSAYIAKVVASRSSDRLNITKKMSMLAGERVGIARDQGVSVVGGALGSHSLIDSCAPDAVKMI